MYKQSSYQRINNLIVRTVAFANSTQQLAMQFAQKLTTKTITHAENTLYLLQYKVLMTYTKAAI